MYNWAEKKFDNQLWIADLAAAGALTEEERMAHAHLTQLTAGSQHAFSGASDPQWSPCGKYVAFLSDRGGDKTNGTAVWIAPARGPGEARLLATFPVAVSNLDWSHDAGGIVVSAEVYLDAAGAANGDLAAMEATAARDKALKDSTGGLDAVVFKRLPIRQWDAWLSAKLPHPFFVKLEADSTSPVGYRTAAPAVDLLSAVPTAVPSGAFGGAEDWAISKTGAVAVSARPPLDSKEAWTTNRHIYLQKEMPAKNSAKFWTPGDDSLLGDCLTADNPGDDTNPAFSPDGSQLAWLTMAGADYEADAVGICVHDLQSGKTRTVLRAETDWEYSPQGLHWSQDGLRLLFTADIRARRALCSLDVGPGAASARVCVLRPEHSTTLFGEHGDDGRLLVAQDSLRTPPELFSLAPDGSAALQLTNYNGARMAGSALGRVGELTFTGPSGDEIQSWLLRPAGLSEEEEANPSTKHPLAVLYHGGPQGSTGDDWHYRWNLQSYASAGFAVLGINFRGSTGFGHAFTRAISAKGGVGWNVGGEDTIACVQHVLEQHGSWIDAERVVGLGASYGGFTSNWLNGNAPKGMFKALVCHCGTFDLRSSYFSTEELFFMEHEFGGTPYEPAAKEASSPYVRCPPSAKADLWETPTLVIHGAKDFRLVESEGIATFTALQRRGVPSEMLYLPSENHHCLNPQNSIVWHETVLNWIKAWTEA
jgi:dipeptidyl aminopeptidase/acylaminoacyl peptidase